MIQKMLIKGGYVVDPDTGFEGCADLLVEEGVIARLGRELPESAEVILDARGLTVLPGLVDLHVHLRDPGQTHKEELSTGAMAAVRGGVTSLLAMPNTTPPVDSPEGVRDVERRAGALGLVHVYQSSAITRGMKGEELTELEDLLQAGTAAFSEDGKSVMNAALMRSAMRRIARYDGLVCDHCEEISLVEGGVMNLDEHAKRLGLPGISNAVEDSIAVRDVMLARETGCRLHLCHCSTEGSVEIVRGAKARGLRVSAEVCPHHFILTSGDIPGDDANYKMNPPLRTRRDVEALREGLADGTIECISTDHAPHTAEEKAGGFLGSPFGIVGLETSAALTYTELVKGGVLTLMQMAEKMSRNPARILRVPGGSLRRGMPADLAIFDFETPWRIRPEAFASKGKNTPFAGRTVYGRTRYTIVGGQLVFQTGEIR